MTNWPQDTDLAGSRFTLDCAHRVINDRDPLLTSENKSVRTEEQLFREQEGVRFEFNVRTELIALHRVNDLALINDYKERTEATLRAITRGDLIIIGTALPAHNGRIGAPDILIKAQADLSDKNFYYPVDIKSHNPLQGDKKASMQIISTLSDYKKESATKMDIGSGIPDTDDSLILAHYWRLLENLGFAPQAEPFGAIIGPNKQLVWRSLNEPLITYDQRFAERLAGVIALLDQDPPHTKPIWNPNWCTQCHWREHCREKLLDEEHVSLIKGVSYLRALSLESHQPNPICTWAELANAFAPDLVVKGWPKPQVEIDHAKARLSGLALPFTPRDSGEKVIPRADVEIDFDMESIQKSEATGRSDCVYLWGTFTTINNKALVTQLGFPQQGFRGFSIFEENLTEADALVAFWKWTQNWITKSHELGFSLNFYCYHGSAESTAMKAVNKRATSDSRLPSIEDIEELKSSNYWIDIENFVKLLIWPTESQSLKVVGKLAGATWDELGANGALATVWFDNWFKSEDPTERANLKQLLLDYNRNDVEATLTIRNWLNDGLQADPPTFQNIKSLDGRIF